MTASRVHADFGAVAAQARRGDGIYFDPPYVPVSRTSSFTSYAKTPFGEAEQKRLVEVYRACCKRGAVSILSNSDCDITRELYADLQVHTVQMKRAINSNAARRGAINEVLVSGVSTRSQRPAPRRVRRLDQRRSA